MAALCYHIFCHFKSPLITVIIPVTFSPHRYDELISFSYGPSMILPFQNVTPVRSILYAFPFSLLAHSFPVENVSNGPGVLMATSIDKNIYSSTFYVPSLVLDTRNTSGRTKEKEGSRFFARLHIVLRMFTEIIFALRKFWMKVFETRSS